MSFLRVGLALLWPRLRHPGQLHVGLAGPERRLSRPLPPPPASMLMPTGRRYLDKGLIFIPQEKKEVGTQRHLGKLISLLVLMAGKGAKGQRVEMKIIIIPW